MDKEAPVGFADIRLSFELETDADDEQLATLLKLTERYCVVSRPWTAGRSCDVALGACSRGRLSAGPASCRPKDSSGCGPVERRPGAVERDRGCGQVRLSRSGRHGLNGFTRPSGSTGRAWCRCRRSASLSASVAGHVAAELHDVRDVVVVLVVGAVAHAVAVAVRVVGARAGVGIGYGVSLAVQPFQKSGVIGPCELVVVGEAVGVLVALVVGEPAVCRRGPSSVDSS